MFIPFDNAAAAAGNGTSQAGRRLHRTRRQIACALTKPPDVQLQYHPAPFSMGIE
jgi:hypothetical protein